MQESSKRVAEKKGFSKRKWREYEESKVGGINYKRINKYFKEHFALSGARRLTEIDSLGLGR